MLLSYRKILIMLVWRPSQLHSQSSVPRSSAMLMQLFILAWKPLPGCLLTTTKRTTLAPWQFPQRQFISPELIPVSVALSDQEYLYSLDGILIHRKLSLNSFRFFHSTTTLCSYSILPVRYLSIENTKVIIAPQLLTSFCPSALVALNPFKFRGNETEFSQPRV